VRFAHVLAVVAAVALGGCDIGKFTVNTTSKVLIRAQPSLQMESDYELARQAIPGALKTIETPSEGSAARATEPARWSSLRC